MIATLTDQIAAVIAAVEQHPIRGTRSEADREFSLAVTHLEDAQMRVARGLARAQGRPDPR